MFAGKIRDTQISDCSEASSEAQRLKGDLENLKLGRKKGLGKILCYFCKGSRVNDVVPVGFQTYPKLALPESRVCFSTCFLHSRNSQSLKKKNHIFIFRDI